ncbi:UNVERIFIED_CONTAM: hypothetical protein K2H54_012853 [Gekko kuhli]
MCIPSSRLSFTPHAGSRILQSVAARHIQGFDVHAVIGSKQKHMKLRKYLKEICERQKKSLLRNQDLLKEFDCIEAHIRKFASRSESLQKLKAEYERQVKSRLALQKNSTLKDDGEDNVKQLVSEKKIEADVNLSL